MLRIFVLLSLFFQSIALSEENYFLTLRNNEVNLRLGPSFDYPIKIIYKKKYLPILITERSENFRKIRDHEKNSGWIHISQLSKKKAGILLDDKILYRKPTIYSKPIAKIKRGRLTIIAKCKKEWCKIKTENYSGWIEKKDIWGKL